MGLRGFTRRRKARCSTKIRLVPCEWAHMSKKEFVVDGLLEIWGIDWGWDLE